MIRDKGGFMNLTTPFTSLRNATANMCKINDFYYQLPKDIMQDYWEKECIDHTTSSHCIVYLLTINN